MHVALIVGSGISLPLDFPSVDELTESVCRGDKFNRATDSLYHAGPSDLGHEEDSGRVRRLLALIEEHVRSYYESASLEHSTNYEDIFYVVSQLFDDETGEYDNPAVYPFLQDLKRKAIDAELCGPERRPTVWRFDDLLRETQTYVECVVWHELGRIPDGLGLRSAYRFITDISSDSSVDSLDIFSLNHDRCLDRLFDELDLSHTFGFEEPINGIRYWNSTLFDTGQFDIRVYKMHGSVNWFQFPSHVTDEQWRIECVGIPLNGDYEHQKDRNGKNVRATPPRPLILAGTFNKMLTYTSGVFADMYARMTLNLDQADQLVVSGYGFSDKGINSRILDWVWKTPTRRLIVVDPEPERLTKRGRTAFRRSWDPLQKSGKLCFYASTFSDVAWADVKSDLES